MRKQAPSYFKQVLIYSLILQVVLFSCKKKDILPPAPAENSEFALNDSLKVSAAYATGPFADIFNKYNDKTYIIKSIDKVGFDVQKINADIIFRFSDSSVNKLVPGFTITLKNSRYELLLSEYNLTNTSLISLADDQRFSDGSSAMQFETLVLKGVLKIFYNRKFNTVSGEIVNLKIPVEYYVPEDISPMQRSSNGILIVNGGSTRTVNLKFNNVRVK